MSTESLVTVVFVLIGLQLLAFLGVIIGAIVAIFPAGRRVGGWVALGSGIALIVFAGACFGVAALSSRVTA